ncbi:amidohydrolase family protein [Hylemonella gracilis]|uniref:Amidohydrolase 2 n=1 Tax=Hylemonella gracilis ATCC 19624 TaxID=887062 RepID=F3KT60_9BURK|nr:amidohydrolase family protein [Hylemonella gracilis]EGI77056.1 amidohydrolase 2 [Hylemonella gracilis ATCC 19624]
MSQSAWRRIATEEAWATPELVQRYRQIIETHSLDDPGFFSLWGFFGTSEAPRAKDLRDRIQDMEARRMADMDAAGVDVQLLLLTAPGVQVFAPQEAAALAVSTNDQLAETIRKHPDRFAGLAAVAPHAPRQAALELERAVRKLGLKGAVINSHTMGLYLDDEQYWDVFAAAEALDVPFYIHPNTPSPQMIQPFLPRCMDAAIYGFQAETGLHALRLILSGLFDRFPKLKIVLGHLGEGLPFWLYRIDFMHAGIVRANRHPGVKPLKKKPSDYLRENFWYTTSGMAWEPAISFVQQQMGMDRVMYAMDYPYQYELGEVTAMDALPLAPEHKKMFYETNAVSLFRL